MTRIRSSSDVTAVEIMIQRGKTLFEDARKPVAFTKDADINAFLNDIERYPHAFVLGCVMDRQIPSERAWAIPYRMYKKLGDFSMPSLLSLPKARVRQLMTKPEPLHRFVEIMSSHFFDAVHLIQRRYSGDASKIWSDKPTSAELVYRFLEFEGVGPKIANMAANGLAREFKIPLADYYSIDISADTHVKRVFWRLGLTDKDATVEQIVYRARSLCPDFPGLLDYSAWEVGKKWCDSAIPKCEECYLSSSCPSSRRRE